MRRVIVIGIDGLDPTLVMKYSCYTLMQESCGLTDLSQYTTITTALILSGFLTGLEPSRIPLIHDPSIGLNDTVMQYCKLNQLETLIEKANGIAINFAGYNASQNWEFNRQLMKRYEETQDEDSYRALRKYQVKRYEETLDLLKKHCRAHDSKLILYWTEIVDALSHLKRRDSEEMEWLYTYLNESLLFLDMLLGEEDLCIMMSDHGMRIDERGMGIHSRNGFYSTNNSEYFLVNPAPHEIHYLILSHLRGR